jgi:hypothetical protein
MLLSVQRGAPFVADLRVQWIRLARELSKKGAKPLPLTIQLVGDIDDVVSMEDSNDTAAAKNFVFITLLNTGHASIARALRAKDSSDPGDVMRIEMIRQALAAAPNKLRTDHIKRAPEDLAVRRLVYISHGIRDYGEWENDLAKGIGAAQCVKEPELKTAKVLCVDKYGLKVVALQYTFLPMGPFLLYWDRQKNVRVFMDTFTQNLVEFPLADRFDFVGHSHGSYVLASALQHYKTLEVGHVFFAGSVVPRHYDWMSLIHSGRVQSVVNVAASKDWVVAIFPRFFEQIAEWIDEKPRTGILDIGSAGFRGFNAGSDPKGRVQNLMFVAGNHGAAIQFADAKKLRAVVEYAVEGQSEGFGVFQDASHVAPWLDHLSNLSVLVWLILASVLVAIGYWLYRKGVIHAGVYVVGLLLVLNAV